MADRFPKKNMNPVLLKERSKATFDPEQITYMLDGGEIMTSKRREMEALVLSDKFYTEAPNYHFLSRPERYEEGVRRTGYFQKQLKEKGLGNRAESYFYGNLAFPNETSPTALHSAMFVPTIESQGTEEQRERLLKNIETDGIIGTYAQTELGHGTYVRGLETTATYDPKTEEFIINSPTPTSAKWWPGGRITLGDIGPKFGFDMIDNGFLRFNNVRIPRENMLMKNQQILKDGTYVRKGKSEKLAYGAMIFIRAMVVLDQAARGLAEATTIAIRYSCVRHQSELTPGGPEPQIIEYQTQQYRLFPLLATAYAYYFAGLKMRETYFMLNYEIQHGNVESLPELHASSSGLKALSTNGAMYGIEQCRLACGGHGYSHASGLPKIYVQTTAACTYEGENTVLFLQTARYLAKAYQQIQQNRPQAGGNIAYLAEKQNARSTVQLPLTVEALVDAYKHRAFRMIAKAVQKLTQLQATGKEAHDAWNLTSVELVKAAEAHSQLYVIEAFVEKTSFTSEPSVKLVLNQLFELFALHGIANAAIDFTEDGYIDQTQLDIVRNGVLNLLALIRPNCVALVDAFDFTDHLLGSVLGRYDGNVYENMLKWAMSSPLNKTDVHESFKYLKPTQSKL